VLRNSGPVATTGYHPRSPSKPPLVSFIALFGRRTVRHDGCVGQLRFADQQTPNLATELLPQARPTTPAIRGR
jgi:hypothetical protein